MLWGLILLVTGLFLIVPLLVGVPLALIGLRRWKSATRRYNEAVWPGLDAAWRKQWVCVTCGSIWV